MSRIKSKITLLTILYSINSINTFQSSAPILFERFWLGSTELIDSPALKRSAKPCAEFHLNLENFTFLIACVYRGDLREYNIIGDESKLIVYEEDGSRNETFLNRINYTTLQGYVVGLKNNSNIDGYLYDGRFMGKIRINDTVLYVEDLSEFVEFDWSHSYKRQSIIYENGISSVNCSVGIKDTDKKRHLKEFFSLMEPNTTEIIGKICTLGIYVDTAYYKYSMGSNEDKTRASVIESVKIANSIFRSTDFFGIGQPNNIGIEIKDLVIYKNSNNSAVPSFYPMKRNGIILLKLFASSAHLLDKVTLGVLFTGQLMKDSAVGWAFIPAMSSYDYNAFRSMNGICSISPDGTYAGNNALLVITKGYKKVSTQEQLGLVLTHELGHAFGALHDEDSSHAKCHGYIMSPSTTKWKKGKKHAFSRCSIEDIALEERHFCMDQPAVRKPFCGNAMVEPPEECDCGSKFACAETNSCCTPYDSDSAVPCTYSC